MPTLVFVSSRRNISIFIEFFRLPMAILGTMSKIFNCIHYPWQKHLAPEGFMSVWKAKPKSFKNLSPIWRKVVCFVLLLWDPPNRDTSDPVLRVFGKLSTRRGAWAWFHDIWTYGAKALEY
jgi:hypothetical protein